MTDKQRLALVEALNDAALRFARGSSDAISYGMLQAVLYRAGLDALTTDENICYAAERGLKTLERRNEA